MKISIVIPIYNADKYLKKTLDSVLNQSYKNIELILINDGSTDDSLQICKEYKNKDKRIILINIENSGPGFARNIGIENVSGDYIYFVDADDYLKEDALETLLSLAIEGNYEIISSNFYRVDKDIKVSKNNYETGEISRHKTREEKRKYNLFKTSSSFGYACGKLYKTSFIKENNIKFTNEKHVFLEDTLFNLKAFSYDPNYYVLNQPLYYYNIHEDSLSNKKQDISKLAIRLFEDYEDFLSTNNTYEENLDLFVPLACRVMAWSFMKSMDELLKYKLILDKVDQFSTNETIKRLFSNENSFKELRKIKSTPQIVLYSFIIKCTRYRLDRTLALFFFLNYPIFKIYINKFLKS